MTNKEQGSITVNGFELGYSSEGAGPDVLVVGSSIYYPKTFSDSLRKHLRLVFVDHRGFGKATAPYTNTNFELDVLIDNIETMRQALNLDRIVIMGHSGHGYMALEYAKKYPQHVSHVVLIALSPNGSIASFQAADRYLEESVVPERKALLAASMAQLESDIAADAHHRFIHYSLRSGPRIWFDPTFDATALWQGLTVNPEMFDYVWGNLFQTIDITQGLAALDKPVFLALGRYDYWNPPHLWDVVRDQFHDLCVRIFEKSGHTPQLEESESFDHELLTWLAEKH